MRTYSVSIVLALLLILVGLGFWYWDTLSGFFSGVAPIVTPLPPIPEDGSLPFVVPEGFEVALFSEAVPGARVMVRDPRGTLVVSETTEGRVVALPDTNTDWKADRVVTILSGLYNPHGMVFRCGEFGVPSDAGSDGCLLYVAETNAVKVYEYDADAFTATLRDTLATLPDDGGHYTRTLALDPDGRHLLVSVGSSCNVCVEADEHRASLLSIDMVTKEVAVYARGLRNTVFMARNPLDGALWGTENGRDLLGDDTPPDEINILTEGKNYGWPICYGKNIHDTQFDHNTYIRAPCSAPFEEPSAIDIPAHSAPLGLVFVPEEGWPENLWLDLLVAYHGSWNRSVPTGYKIVHIEFDDQGHPTGRVEDFMTGFMDEKGALFGRPAGLLIEPGGTLYVSDDRRGAIYRVFLKELPY